MSNFSGKLFNFGCSVVISRPRSRDTTPLEFIFIQVLVYRLWLDTKVSVQFKLAVLVYRCLHKTAPLYMMECCTRTADVVSRQHLRSASQRKMIVPRYRLDSYGRRCFAVSGRSRAGIRCQTVSVTQLWVLAFSGVTWKHTFFAKYWLDALSALDFLYALHKFTLYLLTWSQDLKKNGFDNNTSWLSWTVVRIELN